MGGLCYRWRWYLGACVIGMFISNHQTAGSFARVVRASAELAEELANGVAIVVGAGANATGSVTTITAHAIVMAELRAESIV